LHKWDAPEVITKILKKIKSNVQFTLADEFTFAVIELLNALKSLRCLLIFDNAESLLSRNSQGEEVYHKDRQDYASLWQHLALHQGHNQILITTRRDIPNLSANVCKLKGLDRYAAREKLRSYGVVGDNQLLDVISKRYGGSPLLLGLIPNTIKRVFGNNIQDFLVAPCINYDEIEKVLTEQLADLTKQQIALMYWLAIEREPVSLSQLQANLQYQPLLSRQVPKLLDALVSRNLVEQDEDQFSLQNVILEYVTDQLNTAIVEEIRAKKSDLLHSHSLLKAEAKEYIRKIQQRMILQPILEVLLFSLQPPVGNDRDQILSNFLSPAKASGLFLTDNLLEMIDEFRGNALAQTSYATGNLVNLLISFGHKFVDCDLSRLYISQVYWPGVSISSIKFTGTKFEHCIFPETIGSVLSVDFSPDGQTLASGGTDGIIRLWDVETGQKIAALSGHSNWVRSVNFSTNGRYLVSGSLDSLVKIWSLKKNICERTLRGHQDQVWSAKFAAKDLLVISVGSDYQAKVWLSKGDEVATITSPDKQIIAVTIHGMQAASSNAKTVKIWDFYSKKTVLLITEKSERIRVLAFSPDGKVLAGASHDCTIYIWNTITGNLLHTFVGHEKQIWSLSFTKNGQYLISGSADVVKMWDWQQENCFRVFLVNGHRIRSIALHQKDGIEESILAIGSDDGLIKIWDIYHDQVLRNIKNHQNRAWCVSYSPDGEFLATGSDDGILRVWFDHGKCLIIPAHKCRIRSIAISPNSQFIVTGGGPDSTVKVWGLDGTLLNSFREHRDWVTWLVFLDNETIVTVGDDQTIYRWSWQNSSFQKILVSADQWYWGFALDRQHRQLALGGNLKQIKFISVDSGEAIKTAYFHPEDIRHLMFNNRDGWLASVDEKGCLRIWNVDTHQLLSQFPPIKSPVRSIDWHPFQPICAIGSDDGSITILHIDGQTTQTWLAHYSSLWHLCFHPQGDLLATASEDETIKTWLWSSEQQVNSYSLTGV
jgi:WD40 repeat protein